MKGRSVHLRRRVVVHRRLDVNLAQCVVGHPYDRRPLGRRPREHLHTRVEHVEHECAVGREVLAHAGEAFRARNGACRPARSRARRRRWRPSRALRPASPVRGPVRPPPAPPALRAPARSGSSPAPYHTPARARRHVRCARARRRSRPRLPAACRRDRTAPRRRKSCAPRSPVSRGNHRSLMSTELMPPLPSSPRAGLPGSRIQASSTTN